MTKLNKTIQLLTIALNAAFIGAMILIGLVLVPFWQSSDPQVFLNWFSAYSGNIGSLMIPLGPGVLILAIICFFLNKDKKTLWSLTILFTMGNIIIFPLYFLSANTSFTEQTIELSNVSGELESWLKFHWLRVFLALAALVTSMMAVAGKMKE